MCMTDNVNLLIPQGTSWGTGFVVAPIGGVAFDSSWSVRSQVRTSAQSSTVLHSFDALAGNIAIEGNIIKLSVEPLESSAWKWTSAVYDVEISKAGTTYRIVEGRIKVTPEVTR